MCGSLKLEGMARRIGNEIVLWSGKPDSKVKAIWQGFIKEEKLNWWKRQTDLRPMFASFDSFTEGPFTFQIPDKKLPGYLTSRPVILNGRIICPAESFKIVTRAPISQLEKHLHDRWPVAWNPDGSKIIWEVDNGRTTQMRLL